MACAPVRAGGEGSHSSQMEYLFHSTAAATEARQQLRDTGGTTLTLPTAQQPIFVPCLDGPGRLPSTLVRVVVSGLPADFMIPGAIRVLLECAGYVTGGAEGVIVRAEHGGEHRADMSAFAPDVMKIRSAGGHSPTASIGPHPYPPCPELLRTSAERYQSA